MNHEYRGHTAPASTAHDGARADLSNVAGGGGDGDETRRDMAGSSTSSQVGMRDVRVVTTGGLRRSSDLQQVLTKMSATGTLLRCLLMAAIECFG